MISRCAKTLGFSKVNFSSFFTQGSSDVSIIVRKEADNQPKRKGGGSISHLHKQVQIIPFRVPHRGRLAYIAQSHQQAQTHTGIALAQHCQQLLNDRQPCPATAQRALAQADVDVDARHGLQRPPADEVGQRHAVVERAQGVRAVATAAVGPHRGDAELRAGPIIRGGGGAFGGGGRDCSQGWEAVDDEGMRFEQGQALAGDALVEEQDGGRAEAGRPGRGGGVRGVLVDGGELPAPAAVVGGVELAGGWVVKRVVVNHVAELGREGEESEDGVVDAVAVDISILRVRGGLFGGSMTGLAR